MPLTRFRAGEPLSPAPGRVLRTSLIERPGVVIPGRVVHRLIFGRQRPEVLPLEATAVLESAGILELAGVSRRPRALRPSAFVLAHARALVTSWPAGRPVARSVSRAACSSTAAAAASTTWRRA